MTVDISIAIAIVSTCFAVYFGVVNARRNKTSDDKSDATQLATMIVKIDAVGTTVNEIKSDMREFKSEQQFLRDKIIEIEASVKSAHKRIDSIEDLSHE